MKAILAPAFAILLGAGACLSYPPQSDRPSPGKSSKQAAYDGDWWFSANSDTRSGYFWGADDCLVWSAHVKGFWGSSDAFDDFVTKFYETHPTEKKLPVVEAWRGATARTRPPEDTPGGEVWTNPHGFLNGSWYRQSSYDERIGFLEGYIGCLRTYVKEPTESYSRQPGYYDDNIWDYIDTHPKAYNEPIATMLARYRDKLKPQ